MAKMTRKQKRKELEKVAAELARLDEEAAVKIGRWIVSHTDFEGVKDFREHYEMLQKFYDENHNLDNSEAVQNEPNDNGKLPFDFGS